MICHICGTNSMKFLNRSNGPILFHIHWKNCHEQRHVVDENEQTKRGRICSHVINAMAQERISNNMKRIDQDGIKRLKHAPKWYCPLQIIHLCATVA